MKHLYEINEDWEIYAADTVEQATAYYKYLTNEDPEYVTELDDNITVPTSDNPNADPELFGKSYSQIASEYNEPTQVFSSYC